MEFSGLLDSTIDFCFGHQTLIGHFGVCLLLWRAYTKGLVHRKLLLLMCSGLIALTFILWLCISNTWVSIVTSYLCVVIYERLSGPRLRVKKKAVFQADDSVHRLLKELDDVTRHIYESPDHVFIETDLQYVEYNDITYGTPPKKPVVLIEEITTIARGYDELTAHYLNITDKKSTVCFHVTLTDDSRVTYFCGSEKSRDVWSKFLFNNHVSRLCDCQQKWQTDLSKPGQTEHCDTEAPTVDTSLKQCVMACGRSNITLDGVYAKDMYNQTLKSHGQQGRIEVKQFNNLVDAFTKRADIQKIYNSIIDVENYEAAVNRKLLYNFITQQQKESISASSCRLLIEQHECIYPPFCLSELGLTSYLQSSSILQPHCREVYQDMTQPLNYYYIATSHNTYLTKDQLKSRSSCDAYINAFKKGCKCVELDMWDGPNNEPIIYHGHTLTSKILFKDVLQTIKENAFIKSEYPVILSFENHCTLEQQKVMAHHLVNIFGDMMYTVPIPEEETCLPSPEDLKGYIIVKSRKLKQGTEEVELGDDDGLSCDEDDSDDEEEEQGKRPLNGEAKVVPDGEAEEQMPTLEEHQESSQEDDSAENDINGNEVAEPNEDSASDSPGNPESQNGKTSNDVITNGDVQGEVENDDQKPKNNAKRKRKGSIKIRMKTTLGIGKKKPKKAKMAQELSDLIAYCQAQTFHGFKHAKENYHYYEMSSFGEKKSQRLCRDNPSGMIEYTQRQLCRIYPAGSRVDSSNYDPSLLWTAGCQLVALNYQTPDRPMQLNQGWFMDNGGCGYVLKPNKLINKTSSYIPRGDLTDKRILSLKIISGSQLPYSSESKVKSDRSLQITIRLHGIEEDQVKEKTKSVKNNGFYVSWDETFQFDVYDFDLAQLSMIVRESDSFLGQYTLPVRCMQQGYRTVPLLTKGSELLPYASLFVHTLIT